MSINTNDIRTFVIEPALDALDMRSSEAIELMLGTCAVESDMGSYLVQEGGGPAIGIFQMEPDTYVSLWKDYIGYREPLMNKIAFLLEGGTSSTILMATDLIFAAAMARIKYYQDSQPIPTTLQGQAEYWKRVYNTSAGHGTVATYILKYKKYVENG